LYGDGADAQSQQHFEIITILPILESSSSTLDTRLLTCTRNTSKTLAVARTKILEVITWSFHAL